MGASAPVTPAASLYVHVPFCAHKCEYCAFYSAPPSGDQVQRYVQALVRDLESAAARLRPRTVFFGGGTPSLLNLAQWRRVLEAMERLELLGAQEWTVECNPATVSADKAQLLRQFGVNRISMGVQSLDPALLERLGRVHTRESVFRSFDTLRAAGFENINLDLMFAIPGQTLEVWRDTLREVCALQSEHLSSYEVIYEEDTPLFAQLQAGEFSVDEELAETLHAELLAQAEAVGFRQYEVANFAKDTTDNPAEIPARASLHNVNYWRGGSYLGLGPSAAGYMDGVRTRNWANTRMYCELIERGRSTVEFREELVPVARAGETAAFGLRMNAGWPFALFQQTTGFDLRQQWAGDMEALVACGQGQRNPHGFQLTSMGLRFADAAAEQFLR